MRPEETVEKKFVAECKKIGITSLKLEVQGEKGWPDQMVLMPNGNVLFVEFKRPNGGHLSQHQIRKLEKLQALGFTTMVTDSWTEALRIVKNMEAIHDV